MKSSVVRLAASLVMLASVRATAPAVATKPTIYRDLGPAPESFEPLVRDAYGARFTILEAPESNSFTPAKLTKTTVQPYLRTWLAAK